MKTYQIVNTVDLKSCLKDLKWFIKNYQGVQSHVSNARIVVPTERGLFYIELGLCFNILEPNGIYGDEWLWYGWEDYSGDTCYPVAGMAEYEDSDHLYRTLHRKRLAQHCAAKIEAELRSRGAIC